jgi:ureidoglycolate lyase
MNEIIIEPISVSAFSPYGTLITPEQDGAVFGDLDAKLVLNNGIPRFYIMELGERPLRVKQITRHRQVTQTLASADKSPWYLVVAPPSIDKSDAGKPDLSLLKAFEIPGDLAVMLYCGSWHAGPYYDESPAKFFNLELSDTNSNDHHTWSLQDLLGNDILIKHKPVGE